jgi:hypothetical protein
MTRQRKCQANQSATLASPENRSGGKGGRGKIEDGKRLEFGVVEAARCKMQDAMWDGGRRLDGGSTGLTDEATTHSWADRLCKAPKKPRPYQLSGERSTGLVVSVEP